MAPNFFTFRADPSSANMPDMIDSPVDYAQLLAEVGDRVPVLTEPVVVFQTIKTSKQDAI